MRFLAYVMILQFYFESPAVAEQDLGITKTVTKGSDSPFTVNTVDESGIDKLQPRLMTDLLKGIPSVLSQKTSYGQGSPFIRGWTGYNNVMLIDGIRLNNSVFRFGPNQYWATVDPFILKKIEILKGPASSIYGSDAVGGSVSATTYSPFDFLNTAGLDFKPTMVYRYATAERSNTERFQFAAVDPNTDIDIGIMGGITRKSYGDFISGKNQLNHRTGFSQNDSDLKIVLKPKNIGLKITAAYQGTLQDDVSRTEKTLFAKEFHGTTKGTEMKRDLDQSRGLSYLKLTAGDKTDLIFSMHSQDEFEDRLKGNNTSEHQGFGVNTFGAILQSSLKVVDIWDFVYGIDFYKDHVNSFKRNFNSLGQLTSHAIQGPIADNSTYQSVGIFIQNEVKVTNKLTLIAGVRHDNITADLDAVNVSGVQNSFDDNWNAFSGTLRGHYSFNSDYSLYGGLSQGFRAPNLSDLSKLDETSAVEQPSLDLEEEKYLAAELGLRVHKQSVSGYVAYWYTDINDLIIQSPTGSYQGSTQVVRKDNIGDGYVNGIELEISFSPSQNLWLTPRYSRMFGRVEQLDAKSGFSSTKAPLSRLAPETFEIETSCSAFAKLQLFSTCRFVNKQNLLALRDRDDTSRIPPGGTPGYATVDIGFKYYVSDSVYITCRIENLFDKDYRVHGSGSNEPGINAIVSLTLFPI